MSAGRKWLILILMGIFLAIMYGYSESAEKTYGNVVEYVGHNYLPGENFPITLNRGEENRL